MRLRAVVALTVILGACREGPAPFSLPDDNNSSATGQLTYNPKQDHAPAFISSGDSLLYEAGSFVGLPTSEGLLLEVPRSGGIARLILPRVQANALKQPRLSAVTVAPDNKSVAFFELDYRPFLADAVRCFGTTDTAGTTIFLMGAKIRTRNLNEQSDADNAQVSVTFAGGSFNANGVPAGSSTAYPHLRLFEREGVPFFRGSFSPDGTRFVFSDGLQLRMWVVGQSATTPIPNTDDGIFPAWSPDGSTIAYSRHPRTATVNSSCQVIQNGVSLPVSTISKTIYRDVDRAKVELWVIKPDGTGQKPLGLGDAPAWADNTTVVVHRSGQLARVNIATGQGTSVSNSTDAFEPAISKDGRFLAFARRAINPTNENGSNYNIWVASF